MTNKEPLVATDLKEVYKRALLWALQDVIAELRLVDVGHLVSYVFTDSHGNIRDILESSAELYLKEKTLSYRDSARSNLVWSQPPEVVLDLDFKHQDLQIRFSLHLLGEQTDITFEDIRYGDDPDDDGDIERFVGILTDAKTCNPSVHWAPSGLLS
nr:hypothetical protein [uncultured Cohaesibacter sp.]